VGAGQSTAIATRAAAEAMLQPISRSGIVEAGLACETGRMNASSSEVDALASTELTTPAKSTPNATTAIAAAASQGLRDASVPVQTSAPPATARAACACRRSRMGPPKSTSNSIANEPNAAKVASSGLSSPLSPMAKSAGMMIAVRAARRSTAYPRSWVASHASGFGTCRESLGAALVPSRPDEREEAPLELAPIVQRDQGAARGPRHLLEPRELALQLERERADLTDAGGGDGLRRHRLIDAALEPPEGAHSQCSGSRALHVAPAARAACLRV
jgi:hypothetical protein